MADILIVDDSPTVLMSMENLLARLGHRAIKASSAEDALGKATGSAAKLVITDYHMPGKNGVELIRALRGNSQYRFTPMLVLTTESQKEKRDEAKAAGATGWLVKPVDPKQLEGALKQLIPGG
ncbi:MAG: response regulator [Mangrovicoccus sp.]